MIIETIFIAALILASLYIGYLIGKKITELRWQKIELPKQRQAAIQQSRAVLSGQFSEQLSPYLPDFPFSPSEARFIGKPIDFIVFEGMDNKDIKKISFVEVKSGKSNLNKVQKDIKKAVEDKQIGWYEYKVPDDLTKK